MLDHWHVRVNFVSSDVVCAVRRKYIPIKRQSARLFSQSFRQQCLVVLLAIWERVLAKLSRWLIDEGK